jgi:hypothetical protein
MLVDDRRFPCAAKPRIQRRHTERQAEDEKTIDGATVVMITKGSQRGKGTKADE